MAEGLISEKFRFLWVRIPKNASSTLDAEFRSARYEGVPWHGDARAAAGHFAFALLRDPVSRLLSAYQEVSLRQEIDGYDHVSKRFFDLPEGLERFEAFVDELGDRTWDPHVLDQWCHCEGVDVAYFGRVENLDAELATLYRHLGLGTPPRLPRRRSRAGRARDHGYARHFLRDEEVPSGLARRIRELYARDQDLYERSCAGARESRGSSETEADRRAAFVPDAVRPLPAVGAPRDGRELLERFREARPAYVHTLREVPDDRVTSSPVETALRRPRSTDPGHESCPWYPQLERGYLLELDDAYIGDNVVMDRFGYYGFDRWWLGKGRELYAETREVRHLDAAVSIAGWGGEAFQLFVVSALPKLGMVIDLLERPGFENVRIVSHYERASAARWFWETLGLTERLEQKPIDRKDGYVFHADRVYFPQYAPTLDSYGIYARNTLLPVRRRLGVEDPGVQDLVLYLDRPFPLIRSVGNRAQLLERLEDRLRGTSLRLEVFGHRGSGSAIRSREERAADVALFERAKILIGPHGAAFSNMVFARPGSHVVEFLPIYRLYAEGTHPRPVFWGLSQACGLEYWTTEPHHFDFVERDMVVDVDDVLEIVDRILGDGSDRAC